MGMSIRSRTRYGRRDRVAHQIAFTSSAVLMLLAVGAAWWVVSPTRADRAADRIDPLVVLSSEGETMAAIPSALPARPVVVEEETPVAPKASGPTFNDRAIRKARTIKMLVTAYSPDARSCGNSADNITASGYSVWTNGMKLVAADPRVLKYGSVISIPGYDHGLPVPVLDCGGAIKGSRLDVLFPTHEIARKWGKKWLDVTVWEYAD